MAVKPFSANITPRNHSKFRNSVTCYRLRRHRPPGTPLLRWKFDDRQQGYGGFAMSARKLAAGLWQLRLLAEVSDIGIKCGSCDRLRYQPHVGLVNVVLPSHCKSREYGVGIKDLSGSPLLGHGSSHNIPHKCESSLSYPNSAMERATKWDFSYSKTSKEADCLYSHMKHLEDHFTTFSAAASLKTELVQARLRIQELEDEHLSSKKKFEALMRKIGEGRSSWYSRKHHKMREIMDNLKDELSKERKIRKRIDFLNSKLIEELVEAKLSAKQFLQDYEDEKKARELMEEICNELAKKIGEDKAELELLKSETTRIHNEVEEERRMLQLAEVWREERVQMKLIDAKLALEHKYCQMNKLVAELESFLSSSAATLDVMALRKAELIRRAVKSMNVEDSKEFEYIPPNSDSMFSFFEELQPGTNEREIEPVVNYRLICDVSNYLIASPKVNGFDFDDDNLPKLSNGCVACNYGLEEDCKVWKFPRLAEDQGSRCSIEGSDHSGNGVTRGKIAARSRVICYENAGHHSPNTDINDVYSVTGEQPRQESSSVSQFRSLTSNGECCKIMSDEGNARLSNGTICSASTTSSRRKSVDLGNPHITRGMKGSIEWPLVTRKNSLKGNLLKAMIEIHKTHLRKVLK